MLHQGAQLNFIRQRVNLPTGKSSAEIARDIPSKMRAQSFFSARIMDARLLECYRSNIDAFLTGEIGRDECRNRMRQFARKNGFDDGTNAITNLGGTARLDFIIKQQAAMAKAVGDYERMHTPEAMEAFPYVIYRARKDSRTRGDHSDLDGKIFHKDDPFLRTHTPPWEFNCRCYLEECSAKRAGKSPQLIQPPTPPEKVKVESKSGFSFDPAHAFEEFDLSSVSSPEVRGNIREEAEIELGSQVSFPSSLKDAEYKATFSPKDFHTYEDESLPPAADWKSESLPPPPARMASDKAREELSIGKAVVTPSGEEAIFDSECLAHWEVEEGKSATEVDARLSSLPLAIETVMQPLEIWDQGTQRGFIKVFRKITGGFSGCLVFVLTSGKVRTYFLKDINALNKARKGFHVQRFPLERK